MCESGGLRGRFPETLESCVVRSYPRPGPLGARIQAPIADILEIDEALFAERESRRARTSRPPPILAMP